MWLASALWCAGLFALAFGVFWLLLLLSLIGTLVGWWAAINSEWKGRGAAIVVVLNAATFLGFMIGGVLLKMAGYI